MSSVILFSVSALISVLLLAIAAKILPNRLNAWRIILIAIAISALPLLRLLFSWDSLPYALFNLAPFAALAFVVFLCFEGALWKRVVVHFCFLAVLSVFDIMLFVALHYNGAQDWLYGSNGLLSLLNETIGFGLYMLLSSLYFSRPTLWLAGGALSLVMDTALVVYIIVQGKKSALQEELREARHLMELEQAHYREVELRREELAKIRHDFNNQLASIAQLFRAGEEASAKEMISALAEEIDQTKENPYCSVPVVNAVLTEKARSCAAEGIGLEVELDFPHLISVEQLHLCSIFSNLLDNALTACKELQTKEKPIIRLSSKVDGDYLFIKAINPSNKPPKKPAPGHGYGFRILSDLTGRYGGNYRTEYRNGVFTAVASLLAVGEEQFKKDG